jgi:hypothetical protein
MDLVLASCNSALNNDVSRKGISAENFKQSMRARNQVGIGLSYRSAAGYIGWQKSCLEIDYWAP